MRRLVSRVNRLSENGQLRGRPLSFYIREKMFGRSFQSKLLGITADRYLNTDTHSHIVIVRETDRMTLVIELFKMSRKSLYKQICLKEYVNINKYTNPPSRKKVAGTNVNSGSTPSCMPIIYSTANKAIPPNRQ